MTAASPRRHRILVAARDRGRLGILRPLERPPDAGLLDLPGGDLLLYTRLSNRWSYGAVAVAPVAPPVRRGTNVRITGTVAVPTPDNVAPDLAVGAAAAAGGVGLDSLAGRSGSMRRAAPSGSDPDL